MVFTRHSFRNEDSPHPITNSQSKPDRSRYRHSSSPCRAYPHLPPGMGRGRSSDTLLDRPRHQGVGKGGSKRQDTSGAMKEASDDDEDQHNVRRSGRKRRVLYNSHNLSDVRDSFIEELKTRKQLKPPAWGEMECNTPEVPRKKKKLRHQLSQEDLYDDKDDNEDEPEERVEESRKKRHYKSQDSLDPANIIEKTGRRRRSLRQSVKLDDPEGSEDERNEGDMYTRVKRTRSLRQTVKLDDPEGSEDEDEGDMYTRIKRTRRAASIKTQEAEENACSQNTSMRSRTRVSRAEAEEHHEDEEDSSSSGEGEEEVNGRRYPMRNRRQTNCLVIKEDRKKRPDRSLFVSPKRSFSKSYRRLSRRRRSRRGSSSSTSSSSSSDEERFERRLSKSMAKGRSRFLPINYTTDDVKSGLLKDRPAATGSSLADVDPMLIDKSVTFEMCRGLNSQIQALKEAVVLPLLYPEIFKHLDIDPPKGLLFYGPPGTGKTLLARALCNECTQSGRKVAFFMRKGADCLSKWVGESERQLRLLFDQAFKMRPSIIFFDEIDGLAPVRSSKQDQIHASIVSTLLGLIDGVDRRGEIVVIGATNRLDSIDPALRRPGRFDREFAFSLPDQSVRQEILQLATKAWHPPLPLATITGLSKRTQGYTGADLQSLVREAALCALRRRYPHIYSAKHKLQLRLHEIKTTPEDFIAALSIITPSGQRSLLPVVRPLPSALHPILQSQLNLLLDRIRFLCPALTSTPSLFDVFTNVDISSSPDTLSWFLEMQTDPLVSGSDPSSGVSLSEALTLRRPRLLVQAPVSNHLLPALLHTLDPVPVFTIDLGTLYTSTNSTPEETLSRIFLDATRSAPAIIYIPGIDHILSSLPDPASKCLLDLVTQQGNPAAHTFILASTVEENITVDASITLDLADAPVFPSPPNWSLITRHFSRDSIITLKPPPTSSRDALFRPLFCTWAIAPPPSASTALVSKHKQLLRWRAEVLPIAPPEPARKLTPVEERQLQEEDEAVMRELRLNLRQLMSVICRDPRYRVFMDPVDPEEVPDYHCVIEKPMHLSLIKANIDSHVYTSIPQFFEDMDLISANALEYNPINDPRSREIRHKAWDLRDTVLSRADHFLDKELRSRLEAIHKRRAEQPVETTPQVASTSRAKGYQIPQYEGIVRSSKRLLGAPAAEASIISRRRTTDTSETVPDVSEDASKSESLNTSSSNNPGLESMTETHLLNGTSHNPPKSINNETSNNNWPGVSPSMSPSRSSRSHQQPDDHVTMSGESPKRCGRLSSPTSPNKTTVQKTPQSEGLLNGHHEMVSNVDVDETPNFEPISTNQKVASVITNQSELACLLTRCVRGTQAWHPPQLEELYVALARQVNVFKSSLDRRNLPRALESVLDEFGA